MTAPRPPDRRIRRTRAALRAALLDLIAERPLSRIAVSDVTKLADVNRSTFYEHYDGVHELAADACTSAFDELIAAAPVLLPTDDPDELRRGRGELAAVFAHVAAHADLYRAVLGSDGSARVINHLHRRLTIAIHVNLTRPGAGTHADDPETVPHDPAASYLAGALLGTAADWLRHNCPGTPRDLVAALYAGLPHMAGTNRAPRTTGPEARGPGR
ncbi:TetR family transcriptional regulator C-terminal domain-containing protein [Yinghuangia sp. ASG 101]|uniref:TetR/AcrR family transcriptional regulator n=1 Tax=Yinghuangia sp. ASG 101 TaxID=2896848 RepID=UPI001E298FA5|nr:TetR-like C-terminal domain-containing protein [Yinghuangia sp. ASG 101]UGQ12584.1 TetR family transcriptional regulator C-terminal domain-containing protein [Yinghuangia sp. ASG 101]